MQGTRRPFARRFAAPLALCAAAALAGAPAASAAPPWLAPVDLDSPVTYNTGDVPSTATANDGRAVVAFARRDGTVTRIFAAMRNPGGGFEAAIALSENTTTASSPKAVIDSQGNATVAWITSGGVVQAAYRPAGQSWLPPQPLTASDGTAPNLVAGENGGAAIAWWSGGAVATQVAKVAVRPPGNTSFGSAVSVSSTSSPYPNGGAGVYTPRVAMNAAGEVIAIWVRGVTYSDATVHYVVESAIRPAGGPFGTVSNRTSYASGNANTDPSVVATPSGKAFALWAYNDGTNARLDYADRAPGGSFGGANTLTNPTPTSASSQRVAGSDGGSVVVSWAQAGAVYASVRPNGGGFSAPKLVAGSPASSSQSAVAISNSGEAVVAWPSFSTGEYTIFAARRRQNGDFGEVTEVARGQAAAPSTQYGTPSVGLDDQGNGFLAARKDVNTSPGAFDTIAVPYDVVAPVLTGVSAPGTATAGTAVGFAATATDRMGAPSISWDFGDGGAAAGGSVSHAFGSVGVFTVTVKATDGAGNVASTTRLVQVSAAPVVTPPPPPAVDADKDGVSPPADCNDKDPKIKPGAVEIRGNKVDENCDGRADSFLVVGMTTALSWDRLTSGRTRIKSLRVERVKKGDVVALTCTTKSRGCRKAATRKATVKKGTTVTFTRYVKSMTLSAKAKLIVKVTRNGAVSRIITYTMVRKKDPSKRTRCQDPGVKKTKACG